MSGLYSLCICHTLEPFFNNLSCWSRRVNRFQWVKSMKKTVDTEIDHSILNFKQINFLSRKWAPFSIMCYIEVFHFYLDFLFLIWTYPRICSVHVSYTILTPFLYLSVVYHFCFVSVAFPCSYTSKDFCYHVPSFFVNVKSSGVSDGGFLLCSNDNTISQSVCNETKVDCL